MNWQAILEKLKEAGGLTEAQIAAMEKRGAWRVERKVGMYGFRKNGEKLDVLAQNFGPGGMRLECPKALKVNDVIGLRLAGKKDRAVTLSDEGDDVPVKVVWCKKRRDYPTYEAGVVFCSSEESGAVLAARFLLEDCGVSIKSPREKRKAPRARVGITGLFATPDGQMTTIEVHDLAVGGVMVESPRPVPMGTSVSIKIFLDREQPSLDCSGTVVRSRVGAHIKAFDLGIAFTQVPPDHKDRLVRFLSRRLKISAP